MREPKNFRYGLIIALAFVGGSKLATTQAPAQTVTPTWSLTGELNTPRYGHTATLLLSGKVHVAGGLGPNSCSFTPTNTAELYDTVSGTWSATGNLNTARSNHTATLLQNGQVLVTGGHSPQVSFSSAELYDPTTGMWRTAGSFNAIRGLVSATLLTNGKVAFVGSERGSAPDIYTMNPDGTDLKRLTFSSESDTQPAWSPDGTKIVFVRFSGPECYPYSKGGEIFVMNADGSDQRRLTQSTCERSDHSPTWSPDGAKIAFVNLIPPQNGLHVMNANGSDQMRILTPGFVFWSPAWSPDGSKLAVEGEGRIFLINVDGSNPTAISNPTSSDPDFDPVWSPDGSKLLFSKWDCPYECWGPLGIWVVNADGSNQKLLTGEGASGPAWSPDGSRILFGKWTGRSIDLFAMNPDGSNVINITNTDGLSEWDPSWQTLQASTNPIDDPQYFVRQHYLDFLNREPDPAGLAFWTNEITSCGADQHCIEVKRVNVSAAFFLSIEFQQTGYLVYRMYEAAYGNLSGTPVPLTRQDLLLDTQRVGQGVVVGAAGWEQALEHNKNTFATEFVARSRFTTAFPQGMTSEQFVDALNLNAGRVLSQAERDQLVTELASGTKTRAQVLRSVAEDADLVQAEFNKAFVLMQYFGYLRRNPSDAPDADFSGYNFWLNKLDSFGGNFVDAEMVKAFIGSTEYRQRFDGCALACCGCWDY